jgi:hypothetical protein
VISGSRVFRDRLRIAVRSLSLFVWSFAIKAAGPVDADAVPVIEVYDLSIGCVPGFLLGEAIEHGDDPAMFFDGSSVTDRHGRGRSRLYTRAATATMDSSASPRRVKLQPWYVSRARQTAREERALGAESHGLSGKDHGFVQPHGEALVPGSPAYFLPQVIPSLRGWISLQQSREASGGTTG